MVSSCTVYGCKNRWTKEKPNLKFHSYPKDPQRRRRWLHAVKRVNFDPSDQVKICSEHFLQSDYKQREDLSSRFFLKDNAIPSVFPALPLPRHLSPHHRCKSTCACRPVTKENSHQNIKQITNVAEDIIIKISCQNRGCAYSGLKKDFTSHGKMCEYRLVQCPFHSFCLCPGVLPVNKIIDHCDVAKQLKDTETCNMIFGNRGFKAINYGTIRGDKWDDHFILHYAKVDARLIYVWVSMVGDVETTRKFKAVITVEDGPTSITHQGKVFPVDVKHEDIIERETDGILLLASKHSLRHLNSTIEFNIHKADESDKRVKQKQEINWWVCPECELMASTKAELIVHVKSSHVKETSEEKKEAVLDS